MGVRPTWGAAGVVAASVAAALAVAGASARPRLYDPMAHAAAAGRGDNVEANVPPQCYASTEGGSNTCWTCHTVPVVETNLQRDFELQRTPSFSRFAQENHFTNLFVDRSAAAAAVEDRAILAWIAEDNYAPLARSLAALRAAGRYAGFVPDLDLARGFDEEGFARDGSGWRALRYKPFPGLGWPTNGSAGDVFVRLPSAYRIDGAGRASRAAYKANLAIVEAAVAGDPFTRAVDRVRAVEPIDEVEVGVDLDGDGTLTREARAVRGLPATYVGGARGVPVRRASFPLHTEMLHSVRYLDPREATLLAPRMKELRWARKTEELSDWAVGAAYEREAAEKAEGKPPAYAGDPEVGLQSPFGWRFQAFIEDREGRLRAETHEELRFCMGCHGGLGVTVDQTFSFARKVPGADGWRPQDLRGMRDTPAAGHADPEALVYFRRARRAHDLGGNDELAERLFPVGALDEAAVRRAAPGGDRDLAWLVAPSRGRALALDKAYLVLVREQSFARGRDAALGPALAARASVTEETTGLGDDDVFRDGRLFQRW